MYFIKTPWWLKSLYLDLTWHIKEEGKTYYITFDDGPHETATPFVLDQLKKYNAKATFFCLGKNVAAYPEIYQRILAEGHSTGNHTYNHVNGWKTSDDHYVQEVENASKLIHSNLFRPPYGKIKRSQQKKLKTKNPKLKTVMWDVLSGDFDPDLGPEDCLNNVLKNTRPGSIIVFHDSTKAFHRMQHTLPKMLEHFSQLGYQFKALPQD